MSPAALALLRRILGGRPGRGAGGAAAPGADEVAELATEAMEATSTGASARCARPPAFDAPSASTSTSRSAGSAATTAPSPPTPTATTSWSATPTPASSSCSASFGAGDLAARHLRLLRRGHPVPPPPRHPVPHPRRHPARAGRRGHRRVQSRGRRRRAPRRLPRAPGSPASPSACSPRSAHVLAGLGRRHVPRRRRDHRRRRARGRVRHLEPRPHLRRRQRERRRLGRHPRPRPRSGPPAAAPQRLRPDRRARHAAGRATAARHPDDDAQARRYEHADAVLTAAGYALGGDLQLGPARATSAATTSSTGSRATTSASVRRRTHTVAAGRAGGTCGRPTATSTPSTAGRSPEAGREVLTRRAAGVRGALARRCARRAACPGAASSRARGAGRPRRRIVDGPGRAHGAGPSAGQRGQPARIRSGILHR